MVEDMTHDDIADWCALRLRSMGYAFSCSNMTSATHGEQPDVLGIDSGGTSILCEVKVSRSDFLADKKKIWRVNHECGIGDYRVYVTPKGLLKPEEIPYGWMLWEVHGKTKPILKVIKGKIKKIIKHRSYSSTSYEYENCTVNEHRHFLKNWESKSYQAELSWMWKIMQRAIDDGFEPNNYANKYQPKTKPSTTQTR